MMRREIDHDDMIGRKVEGCASSLVNQQMVITFTDGTFTTFEIDYGYDQGDATIEPAMLNPARFGDDELIRLGIATQEEIDDLMIKRSDRNKEYREAAERSEYERLKAKYDSPNAQHGG